MKREQGAKQGAKQGTGGGVLTPLHLEGFIEVEKVNTRTKERQTYKNTITQAGKMLILDKSAARFLLSGGDTFGYMVQLGRLAKILGVGSGSVSSPYAAGRDARDDSMLTCALLNTGAAGGNWTEQTNAVNLQGATLQDTSQVVGFANNNPTPAQETNEGAIDYCLGVYQVDGKTVAERWKFAEGVASGTINMVAMMPADSIKTNHGEGWQVAKCLDRCHIQSPNFGSLSTGYLPPNISGYTGVDEVLLNFIMDGVSQWKYNLATGEMAKVEAGQPFFVVEDTDRGTFDMMVDGDFFYVLTAGSTTMPLTTSTLAVCKVYQISEGMTQVARFNISRKVSGESRTAFKFFKKGTDLYISAWSSNQIATLDTWNSIWKINKGTGGYGTGTTQIVDYSGIGINLPAGLNAKHAGLGTTTNGKMWLYLSCDPEYADTLAKVEDNGYLSIALECNQNYTDDLSSLTFTGRMVFGITPNTYFDGVNILRVGANFYSQLTSDNLGLVGDNTDLAGQIVNSSGTKKLDLQTSGVFLSKPEWCGNLFSFVYLATPIEKVADDILYVTYGYKIV